MSLRTPIATLPNLVEQSEPVRCIECGIYGSPDDLEFVITSRGPVCMHCSERSETC